MLAILNKVGRQENEHTFVHLPRWGPVTNISVSDRIVSGRIIRSYPRRFYRLCVARSVGHRGTGDCWDRHPLCHDHLAGYWAFHHLHHRQQLLDRGRGARDHRLVALQQPSKTGQIRDE